MIGASIDDSYSGDDLAAHICSQVDVVGGAEVPARHLHHPASGSVVDIRASVTFAARFFPGCCF